MNKIVHRIMNIIVAAALMLGGYSYVSAAATLATTFNGGFESVVYQYPNAVDNWLAPQPSPPGDRLTRVTSPVRKGNYSLKVTVKPGDNYGSSGERAEVFGMYGPDGKQIFENEGSGTQFYAISVYLPLDFKSPTSTWASFQQLHSNDIYHSYPSFAIGALDTYYVQMISGDLDALNDPKKSHTVKYPIGALQRGKWVDFVWQIKFAKTFTGTVDVWRRIEGETGFTKVLSVANIPTLSFKSSVSGGAVLDAYWKTGYYTSPETFTRVIYIDSNTRGDNFNDVVAAAFPTSSVIPTVPPTKTATPIVPTTPTQIVTTVPPTKTATPIVPTTPTAIPPTAVPPTATLRTSTVLSAGTYDDANPGFAYSGSWLNYSGVGPFNSTMHYTQTLGNTASFSFNGTGFKLFYTEGTDRGNIGVWVDGLLIATINAKTSTVAWQHKYISPSFAAGAHTVQFKHAGPTGTVIDLDAVMIFP